MLLKERFLFVGVGQAGGNIANELEKRGFYAAYINTSSEDLSTLETNPQNTFHVPTTSGCSKNKEKSRLYVKKHHDGMLNHIRRNFPNQDIVFFVFSSSGGTGAGIAPVLLDILSSEDESKKYGAVMVMPHERESIKCLENALFTYSELTEIENLRSVFLIDNAKGDKLELNKSFARLFDKFVVSNNPNARGNIDADEIETLFTSKGVSTILPVCEAADGTLSLQDNVLIDYNMGCGNVGLYCVDEHIKEEIIDLVNEEFGTPDDYFIGYSDKTNMVMVTEMNYPDAMVETFENIINNARAEKTKRRQGSLRIKSSLVPQKDFGVQEPSFKVKDKVKSKPENTAKKLSKWL